MDASMSMDEDQWSGSVINRRSDFKDAIHAFWVALHRCPPVSGTAPFCARWRDATGTAPDMKSWVPEFSACLLARPHNRVLKACIGQRQCQPVTAKSYAKTHADSCGTGPECVLPQEADAAGGAGLQAHGDVRARQRGGVQPEGGGEPAQSGAAVQDQPERPLQDSKCAARPSPLTPLPLAPAPLIGMRGLL